MEIIIKSDGKVVRKKKLANKMHLSVQQRYSHSVKPSKKAYSRSRDKKAFEREA